MTTDTSVKYFDSTMAGAPVLNASIGSMMAILDACLVNGWAVTSADNIIVASGVATLHVAAGHPFKKVGQVMLVAGNGDALDGEQKITAMTTTALSFATTMGDGTYGAGVATFKVAPLNWLKTLPEGANIPHYKSSDPASTGCALRLDDSLAGNNAYATGIDPISGGQFPTVAQSSGGCYWSKDSNGNTASARFWALIGDGRMFYFLHQGSASYTTDNSVTFFGDFIPTKLAGDPFACIVNGPNSDTSYGTQQSNGNAFYHGTQESAQCCMARSNIGLGGSVFARRLMPQLATCIDNTISGGTGYTNTFPNALDGALYVEPCYVGEPGGTMLRGQMPGQYGVPMQIPLGSFNTGDILTGVAGLPGKTLIAFASGYSPYLGNANPTMFFDLTGPWR